MTQIKTKKVTAITSKKTQFSVNPSYTQERTGDYERRDKVKEKWDNTTKREDGCGNIHGMFQFDINKQTFVFTDDFHFNNDNFVPLYRIMSPALFLYRFISTFFAAPVCYDNYKMIWEYNLVHKPSGKTISFSEWKGAIGFWVPEGKHTELKKEFKADLIELLNYIISEECVHPYDNLVAGCVA